MCVCTVHVVTHTPASMKSQLSVPATPARRPADSAATSNALYTRLRYPPDVPFRGGPLRIILRLLCRSNTSRRGANLFNKTFLAATSQNCSSFGGFQLQLYCALFSKKFSLNLRRLLTANSLTEKVRTAIERHIKHEQNKTPRK